MASGPVQASAGHRCAQPSDPGRPLPFSGAGKVMEAQLPIDRNNNK